MAKSARDKIRLVSSAGTGHFYTTDKNKKEHPGKDGDQEIRSRRSQARDVQRSQDQIKYASCKTTEPAFMAGFLFFRLGGHCLSYRKSKPRCAA